MALKFKDIKDWKPSTISIVDQPSHPMAVFEVYENDEEFVDKTIRLLNDEKYLYDMSLSALVKYQEFSPQNSYKRWIEILSKYEENILKK